MTHDTASEPVLRRDDRDGIATLTLNRPGKFNALSAGLIEALQDTLDAIARDHSVRVVVLAGEGRAFCAGHDLAEMSADPGYEASKALFDQCARVMLTLTRIPQPVIARVHGIATAAGCQLVAMCDLAVASTQARFATSGINVGLFCSTPMVAVTRNLGRKQAMEMLLTGDFMDAETALAQGLVNRVAQPEDLDGAVAALAEKITAKSAASIAFGKRLFHRQLESGLEEAYAMAAETMARNMTCQDTRAGIEAFTAKQPMPPWKDVPHDD
jgi:enoyl-CoA hydratase/carnithine racemase